MAGVGQFSFLSHLPSKYRLFEAEQERLVTAGLAQDDRVRASIG